MKSNIFSSALFLMIALFCSVNLSAQWSSNATAIWNTTLTKNVGIGTSTPSNARLQFDNTNGNKIALYYDALSTGVYGFGINNKNLSAFIPAGADQKFSIRTNGYNGTEKFYVDANGSTGTGSRIYPGWSGTEGGGYSLVHFKNGTTYKGGIIRTSLGNSDAGDAPLQLESSRFDVLNGGTVNLSVANNGYVGIGNYTPTAHLDIKGGPCWSTFCWRKALQLDDASAISFRVSPTVSYGFGATSGENNSLCLFTAADGTTNTPTYRMIVSPTGNIAIGNNTPSYKLDVFGFVRATAYYTSSDRRYKTNIQTLNGALDKILAMRGTSYDFTAEKQAEGFSTDKQAGFIAQEMQTVMPELVKEDKDGMLAINYIGVIPVLVEAMKEQHEVIAEKETRIAALEAKNNELQERLARIEAALGIAATERQEVPAAVTATVSPNPTSRIVTVSLNNTASAKSVTVKVLDSTGREIASRSAAGTSSVQFDLSHFPAGMYVAQVLADGKMVSANKVQLVK